MDPITHAALGASCSQGIFGKYNNDIWLVGALAAMAPDLDIFIRFMNNPLSYEFWHRNFTHSLFFMPIGGLLVGLFFMCLRSYRTHWQITLGAALVGYSTHGLLDASTTYGTVLFWPWNYHRISWDIISIINPFFTIPLVLCVSWAIIFHKPRIAFLGLLFSSLLLVFKSIHHQQALNGVKEYALHNKLPLTKIRAIPDLDSSNWRFIAKINHCLLIGTINTSFLKKIRVTPIAAIPLYTKNIPFIMSKIQQEDLAIFSWFSDDYVIIASTDPLILADGRYVFSSKSLHSLWGIKFLPNKKHIIYLNNISLKVPCTTT